VKKYRMYVDEVGNSDLGSSDNPLHRFLSLTGVIIDLDYVRETLHPQMENMKREFFDSHPDDPIILHRKEIVNVKHPFETLRNEKMRFQFDRQLLNYLRKWEYTVITVCLDKKAHKETYQIWRYDPYHYCLAILLERFSFLLKQCESVGDVMAESRGGKEDMRLKSSFLRLWRDGTQYIGSEQFQEVLTSKELKIKPKSNNISGLQLADIIAHPSRNEILIENNMQEKPLAPFAQKIVSILQEKYYQHSGKVFGKKFL
jgi:hypothetical protein